MKRKVLITGAAGRIGSFITAQWADRYDLVLSDVRTPGKTHGYPFHQANLSDFDTVRALCDGIDTVVHLGADPSMQATWESLLPNNVIATYNVFESAHQAGCRRVIFASSVNAVLGYPHDVQVNINMPIRPINLYGATKVWGEAVASSYAAQTDLSCICLRFGWVVDRDSPDIKLDHPYLDIALTYHDLARLVASAVDAPDEVDYRIFHGVSNNRWKRLDISAARAILGYDPQDDAFEIAQRNAA
ncbi:MAG: NAD(P)-dependent oxidoreductase [Caldilineaceae bacterium]|nr:NAD(P)-dependent oxidoreductase [Caldilineaceae bacterium]